MRELELATKMATKSLEDFKLSFTHYPIWEIRPSLDLRNRYLIWCDPNPLEKTQQEYLPANWVR